LQPSPALLFFKLIEVETKFAFANSISAFSRSQDPEADMDRSRQTEPALSSSLFRDTAEVTVPSAEHHASTILSAYQEAQAELLGLARSRAASGKARLFIPARAIQSGEPPVQLFYAAAKLGTLLIL
jgi:hypothetical protein